MICDEATDVTVINGLSALRESDRVGDVHFEGCWWLD